MTIFATFMRWRRATDEDDPADVAQNEDGEPWVWERLVVKAEFHPEPGAGLRERILLARMAGMFKAREVVTLERSG